MKTPVGDAPVIPLLILMTGAYLTWFGVHYWGSDTRFPTDPLKNILQGNPAGTPGGKEPAVHAQLMSDAGALQPDGGTATSGPPAPAGAPASPGQFTQVGTFSHAQLMQLWQNNGGSASTAHNAATHAIQESSGNPKITSHNPDGGINVGLWQLDTKGVGSGYTVSQLQDPDTNARITVMHTANGTNWSQWATSGD